MASTPKGADARLTDLDVREVSVVDRPANKRRFLIVKRDDGKLAVLRTEESMSRTAIPREAAEEFGHVLMTDDDDKATILKDDDIADLVGMGEDAAEDASEETDDEEGEIVEVEKGVRDDAIKITKAALQRLMGVANKLKGAKEKAGDQLAPPLANEVRTVAQALSALAERLKSEGGGKGGKGKDDQADAEKAAGDVLSTMTQAIEKLMSAVNTLKELAPDATIPGNVVTTLTTVATSLMSLAEDAAGGADAEQEGDKGKGKQPKGAPKEEAEKALRRPEVFVKRSDDDDPEVIIKAGRKMKRTRLSLFKKAVEMLTEILREIDAESARQDAEAAQEGKGRKTKTEKEDGEFQQKLLETLTSIKDEVGKVNKRVDELEGTRPAGAEEDPPAPVEKKARLWGNIFSVNR